MARRFLLQIYHTGCITSTVIPAVARLDPRLSYGHVPRLIHCSSVFCKSKSDNTNLQEIIELESEKKPKSLVTHDELFERAARDAKCKASFNRVLETFNKKDIRRRGHVEFIYAALKKMPEFGVERDITVYNKLLDVFPKEVFVPRNFIQRMFNHYPRQQECGVQVLEQMENYGIMPNMETKVLLVQIFGEKSHPMRKYQRIMYWFPKFKNVNPFPVPHDLLQDPVDLARFSLTRIANDLDAKITVHQFPSTHITEAGEEISQPYVVELLSGHPIISIREQKRCRDSGNGIFLSAQRSPERLPVLCLGADQLLELLFLLGMHLKGSAWCWVCWSMTSTFSSLPSSEDCPAFLPGFWHQCRRAIGSGEGRPVGRQPVLTESGIQSPEQRNLLAKHNPNRPVFVEGPFPLWLRKTCVHYYLLRADPIPPEEQVEEELDPELTGPEQSFFFPQYINLDLKKDLGDDDSFDVDEVVEGAVYAMCMTGQSDQATLAQWISGLQENNPVLGKVPTVFRLDSGFRELQKVEDIRHDPGHDQHPGAKQEHIIEEKVLHSQGMKR
ncbi:evolutionarily conserved signaling intermediate in Toll pathway, mitochondrial [Silurus meridionalis]|nr:evolutionarily conserved signaling intermediate in Toll pathway, mitochondrial [Silurus meridionalis]